LSVWLRMGRDSFRLELLDRWQRPPVVAPHRGTLRARVREAAGIAPDSVVTQKGEIDRAFAGSPNAAPFLEASRSARRVSLAIPDATRRGPWEACLESAVRWLTERTPEASSRNILAATGVHRPSLPDGIRLPDGWSVIANGQGGYAKHQLVGTTGAGTEVRLHPAWVEADLRVVLADLSFHYFAGFGGGRKLVFPGLGEPAGILSNHKRCLTSDGTLHPACESGNLTGNPVHEDLVDAVSLCPPDLLIQAYEPAPGDPTVLSMGHWREEHERGCLAYLQGHALDHTQRAEVLIADAGGFPRDASLLQAHKSLRHASRFLAPGGRLLLVAGLEDGSGSETFERLWALPSSELARRAAENYELHLHTALSLRTICENFEIGILSRMEPDRLATARIQPFGRLEDAVDWLEARGKPRAWGWLGRAEEVVPHLVGQGGDG
jgi:nickel-dependent lactate racemase